MNQIAFGNTTIDRAELDDGGTPLAQSLMHQAYNGQIGKPQCLCKPTGVAMTIAKVAGGYILKRLPMTGDKHEFPTCPSSSTVSQRARQIYARSALKTDDKSTLINIALNVPLVAQGKGQPPPVDRSPRDSHGRAARMSISGLMQIMWEQAGLNRNTFDKKSRTFSHVQAALMEQSHEIVADDKPLNQRIFMPTAMRWADYKDPEKVEQNRQLQLSELRQAAQGDSRAPSPLVLVVGQIRHVEALAATNDQQTTPYRISMRASIEDHKIHDYYGIIDRCVKADPRGWLDQLLREPKSFPGARVWLAMACELMTRISDRKPYLRASHGTLWATNETAMPVEDSAQLYLCQEMIAERRDFVKPMRMDSPLPLADFILKDTQHDTPLEVLSESDKPSKDERMKKMLMLYPNPNSNSPWVWRAAPNTVPPSLPLRKK
jgi:hypothetical protein